MKSLIFSVLSVILALGIFTSCSSKPISPAETSGKADTTATTPAAESSSTVPDQNAFSFVSPSDEIRTTKVFTAQNADGIKMEVTIHGYASESQQTFYVKNNEYFLVDVQITNTSENTFYQWLPTWCRDASPNHNHEISFAISDGKGNELHSSAFAFACPERIDVWELSPGQSCQWTLKLAAGKENSETFDLPADGWDYSTGIQLYDDSIYSDGACLFEGGLSFSYAHLDNGADTKNEYTITTDIDVNVVYVSDHP